MFGFFPEFKGKFEISILEKWKNKNNKNFTSVHDTVRI